MPSITEFKSSGLLIMVLGTLFFSVGSVFIRLTGARLPALEIVFARSLVMLLYCYFLAKREGAYIPGHRKPLLFLRAVLGFATYFCLFYAIIHLPLADATIITLAFPLIVPLWATLFLKEPLEPRTILCIFIGAAGMLCVTQPTFLFGGASSYAMLALMAAIGAALLSSICVTLVRKLTATEHPLVIVLYAAATGTIGAPLFGAEDWLLPTWPEALMLVSMGICMSIGQHCITVGYSRSTASKISVMFYMEVVFAAIFGFLLFQETPDAMTIAGATLIITGAGLLGMKSAK